MDRLHCCVLCSAMQHFHGAASCEQQPEGRPWEVAGVDMFAVLWPLDQTPQAVSHTAKQSKYNTIFSGNSPSQSQCYLATQKSPLNLRTYVRIKGLN